MNETGSSIPDWIGSIGTALAFLATFGLLLIEFRDRRAERNHQEKSQASLVSAWLGDGRVESDGDSPTGYSMRWKYVIRNGSDEPVYAIAVAIWNPDNEYEDPNNPDFIPDWGSVGPKVEREGEVSWPDSGVGRCLPEAGIHIAFRDSAGACWSRDMQGKLKKLERHPLEISADS